MRNVLMALTASALVGCAGIQKTVEKAVKDHPEIVEAVKEKAVKAIEGLITDQVNKYLVPEYEESLLEYEVHFSFDSDALGDEAHAETAKIVQWLKDNQGSTVLLIGSADKHGPEEYNMLLGNRRSNRVAEAIWKSGIAHARISAISVGSAEPSGKGSASDRAVRVVGAKQVYKELREALK